VNPFAPTTSLDNYNILGSGILAEGLYRKWLCCLPMNTS